jgi:hypothetical protein
VTIGPVQLIALGFEHPRFRGEIITELEQLRESGTVRVLDALAVYKDAEGDVEVETFSDMTPEPVTAADSPLVALLGLSFDDELAEESAVAEAADEAEDAWDVLADIPDDSAAALILLEHTWAIPLRDAVVSAGGFRLADGFISPLDLVEIGLTTVEEAKELHALETAAAAR